MGVLSKIHRFREAGEDANVNNVERFGRPARSLFTSTKVMTLHHRIEITDAGENVVYRAETKFPSLHDKTDVFDASGRPVAHIERKFFTLHERHFITMADGTAFELSNELFHLVKDVTNIEGLGWQLRGNILGLNFELYDQNGQVIAVIAPHPRPAPRPRPPRATDPASFPPTAAGPSFRMGRLFPFSAAQRMDQAQQLLRGQPYASSQKERAGQHRLSNFFCMAGMLKSILIQPFFLPILLCILEKAPDHQDHDDANRKCTDYTYALNVIHRTF